MGIAGSIVDLPLWEKWLGMRVEAIDMTEVAGRMSKGEPPFPLPRPALQCILRLR
jgi:L-fucose isomerase-like protein